MKKIIHWAPRILGIIFALFLGLFSLDVFGMGLGFWQAIGAFLVHSLPSIALLVVVAIAWKYDLVGAAAFFAAGIVYIILAWSHWYWWPQIAGPAFLTGILFYLSWRQKKREIQA